MHAPRQLALAVTLAGALVTASAPVAHAAPEARSGTSVVQGAPSDATAPQAQVSGAAERSLPLEGNVLAATSTADFMLAGVTWDIAGPEVTGVELRVREGGSYGDWERLEINEASTAVDGRLGTQPLITNGADGVEVRLTTTDGSATRDARVETVDPGTSDLDGRQAEAATPAGAAAPSPVISSQDAAAASASAAASTSSTPSLSAAQVESLRPAVVSRSAWGADESLRRDWGTVIQPKAMVLHHTASTNSYTAAQAAAQVRGIYVYQAKTLGWGDIGYNFLVDKFGTVYEGRHRSLETTLTGAHTAGFNTQAFGVSALGNYEEVDAPAALVESITRVGAWQVAKHGIDLDGTVTLTSEADSSTSTVRFRRGQQVSLPTFFGHITTSYTACPGKHLIPKLPAIRTAMAARIAAVSAPVPEPVESVVVQGPDTVGSDTALRATADWSGSVRTTVRPGHLVTRTGYVKRGWVGVRTQFGRIGWVPGSSLEPAEVRKALSRQTVRTAPDWSSTGSTVLGVGEPAVLTGSVKRGWAGVRTLTGRIGWVPGSALGRAGLRTAAVDTPLRATADWSGTVRRTVRAGESVVPTGYVKRGWVQVRALDGTLGYVAGAALA